MTDRVITDGFATDVVSINTSTFLNVIGFSVYAYEGIGVILPIMEIAEDKERYPVIVFIVITTVFVLYTVFGEFCYFVLGNGL